MSGGATIMEMPALGRQFQLGMLYDATTDKLIQGQELWDKDTIQNAQKDTPDIDMQLNVITDDSLSTKSQHLGATGGIKMNLLAGLVNVSGAADYYNDHKSTRQVVRVSLHSKFRSRKQEIDIKQLGPIKDSTIISATRATHVVSRILFGFECFLIIDRPYSVEEEGRIIDIQDKAAACARLLKVMYDSNETNSKVIDLTEASIYKFKLHCDISLSDSSSLSNFDEVKAFLCGKLFPLAKQGNKCLNLVPKKIWLYPLTELDSSAAFVAHSISSGIIEKFEEILGNLLQAEVWVNDIQKNNKQMSSILIQCFQQQKTKFLQLLKRFRSDLMQQLSSIIPRIRNGLANNDELLSLLKQIADSPFSSNNLKALLKGIEQEIKVVTLCLKNINSVKIVSSDDLESLGFDYDNVVSFEFRLGGSHKANFDQMDKFLLSKKIANDPHTKIIPWYQDGSKKKSIQLKAKTFKEFAQINNQKDDTNITFVIIVSVSNDTPSCEKEGAAIVLYGDENPVDFDLPSKPLSVEANYLTKNEVTLTWSKPKFGADSIISYRISHRPTKNPPVEWIFTNTSGAIESQTLTQLSPDCEYEFRVEAKCKVGFSITSDVITFKIPLEPESSTAAVDPKLKSASELDSISHGLIPPQESASASALNNLPLDNDTDIPNSGYHTPPESASVKEAPLINTPQNYKDEWRVPDNPCLMPTIHDITYKSVLLKWNPPETPVESYTVYYHQHNDPSNTEKKITLDGQKSNCLINDLIHDTKYDYKLYAKLSIGITIESDGKDVFTTPSYLPFKIRSKSKLMKTEKKEEHRATYRLTKHQTMIDKEKRLAKYKVGQPNQHYPEKVLMLVGATGAGKTTLINGIANYMYGVQWDDDFRFVLINNEPKKSQAYSQTSWITAYTLYRDADSPIPYSLTIIDTPGFGDTEGIERDKKVVDQIKNFFSVKPPHGIDIFHGIGFVAQASLARLSKSQKYIFDSILSIYGRDVVSNIFLMTTFADGQLPPVLEAIKVAEIPHQTYFKFNNSALFVRGKEDFDAMFWKMGVKSFTDFFVAFDKAEPRSLQLTREVLNEREQLENVLKELQPQIRAGLMKMNELQEVVIALQENKALIEENKDFKIKVKVTKQKKVDKPTGHYTTNCLKCNYTCHEDCKIPENDRKRECCAMNEDGNCKICPNKCIWSSHVNNPYIFKLYEEEEIRTATELKERYDTAKEGESRAETMISNIKGELDYLEDSVLEMVDSARKSLMRLDLIALKPNPLSEVGYIDELIALEKLQQESGYLQRVNAYQQLRKKAEIVQQIKIHDPTSVGKTQGPIFSIFGNGAKLDSATIEVLNTPAKKKPEKSRFNISWIWKGK